MKPSIAKILAILLCTVALQSALVAGANEDDLVLARKTLQHHHGGESVLFAMADRLEYQTNEGEALSVWEAQGWYGGDINKIWLKTEGEYEHDDNRFEEAEIQVMYSRAISAFWDIQAGLRYDFNPNPSRSFAVLGVQGISPYWFEVDATGFISDEGDVSFRLEVEYELLLTQRLILQPRLELDLALHDNADTGSGSGLNSIDAGFRIRYEISREFAPYIGISWGRTYGETADFRKADGEQTDRLSVVAGLRFWY